MSKPKIYATGNENIKGESNISYYIFEKEANFLDWLSKLLVEVLEIQNGEEQAKYVIKRKETDKGEWLEDEIYFKEIKNPIVPLRYTSQQAVGYFLSQEKQSFSELSKFIEL